MKRPWWHFLRPRTRQEIEDEVDEIAEQFRASDEERTLKSMQVSGHFQVAKYMHEHGVTEAEARALIEAESDRELVEAENGD